MMSSRIKYIQPSIFNNEIVSSWFTLRNQDLVRPENTIPGLNLGLNTKEKEAIVSENRILLLTNIEVSQNQIAFAEQVHKTDVEYVTKGGTYPEADAFVTDKPGLALAIQVADCAAVLFGDEKNRVIGAAHAGWRGAVGEIIPITIHKMVQLGTEINEIKAFISPCISLKNFEVGEEVASQFPNQFVDRNNYKKPHVDLKAFIRHQMMQMGMESSNIELNNSCTIDEDQFYSYRRQKEQSGRMMGIIKLN